MKIFLQFFLFVGYSYGIHTNRRTQTANTKCSGVCIDGSTPRNGGTLIPMLDVNGNGKFDDTCLSANEYIQSVDKDDESCQVLQLFSSIVDCGCSSTPSVCSPCYGKDDTPDYTKNISKFFPNSKYIQTCADLVVADTVDSFFSWLYRNSNFNLTAQDDSLGIPKNISLTGGPIDTSFCRPYHFIHAALCGCSSWPTGSDSREKNCELCPSGFNIGNDMTKLAYTENVTKQPVLCGVAIGQLAQFKVGFDCDEIKKMYADDISTSIENCCIQK